MIELINTKNLVEGNEYKTLGHIKLVERDGNKPTNQPIRLLFQLEESKQTLKISSWDYGALETFKKTSEERKLCNITFRAKSYNGNLSNNLLTIEITEDITKIPLEVSDIEMKTAELKKAFAEIINSVKNKNYQMLLNELILNSPNFFKWKAAYSVHHSFEGGLATHTLNAYNDAVNLANNYNGLRGITLDYDLIITGVLLHDIGKLQELDERGNYTLPGKLLTHLEIGIEMIVDACIKLNINKSGQDILLLKHVIASHHRKLEYGAIAQPAIPEAVIVSNADASDAEMESMIENLESIETNGETPRIKGLDDMRIIKLY